MRQSHRALVAAAVTAFVLWGCSSDDGPDGTTAVPEPSGATEEVPSQATEAAPETEAAPR